MFVVFSLDFHWMFVEGSLAFRRSLDFRLMSGGLLIDVHWMFIGCLLDSRWVPRCMFMGFPLDVRWIFVGLYWMFVGCSLDVRWLFVVSSLDSRACRYVERHAIKGPERMSLCRTTCNTGPKCMSHCRTTS